MYLKLKKWESLNLIELRRRPLEASRLGRYVLKVARIFNEPERALDSPLHETMLEKRRQQDAVVAEYAADSEQLLARQQEERLLLYQQQRDERSDLRSDYEEKLAQHIVDRKRLGQNSVSDSH